MKYKKIMMLTIILTCLLAVSTVSAADNVTNSVISADDVSEDVVSVDETNTVNYNCETINQDSSVEVGTVDLNDGNKILSSVEDDDVISFENGEDVLSASPPYNKYSLSVSDITINSGTGGSITISVSSSYGYSYAYDFTLMVYDSKNVMKINQRYYGSYSKSTITHSISPNQLSAGTYTIELINHADSRVMDTAKLTVKSDYPKYSDYSVRISDTTIDSGSGGSISMSITPASSIYNYKYDYTLKVYDSNNKEKVSQSYYGTSAAYSKSYNVNTNQLSPGTYTIKIINYADNKVMATSKLTVKSSSNYPSYSDYNVKLYDCNCDFGTAADVDFTITPSHSHTYKYNFYLKIYDSNNNEKFSKRMYSTEITSVRGIYLNLVKEWNPGIYTMKIINYYDQKVMSTAKLTVKQPTPAGTTNEPTSNTVKKTTPKLTASAKTFKKSVKTKSYTVTLKTNKNKVMSGKYVTLNVNKKTYKVKTNSKGQATFKITNLKNKGTFKVVVKYAGDKYYNSKTVNTKITVK